MVSSTAPLSPQGEIGSGVQHAGPARQSCRMLRCRQNKPERRVGGTQTYLTRRCQPGQRRLVSRTAGSRPLSYDRLQEADKTVATRWMTG